MDDGVCCLVGCDYLRESWMQSYGTMGSNATGQEGRERGSQSVADYRAGMEGSLSLDYLVESTSPRNSIAILRLRLLHRCIAAIPYARVRARARCPNIQLPAYIPHPSINPLSISGLRDSKEDPVRRGRKATYYVPTLERGHSQQPATTSVCLVFARPAKTKTTNKAVVNGQWLTPPASMSES